MEHACPGTNTRIPFPMRPGAIVYPDEEGKNLFPSYQNPFPSSTMALLCFRMNRDRIPADERKSEVFPETGESLLPAGMVCPTPPEKVQGEYAMNQSRLEREIRDLMQRYREAGYFPSAVVRVFNRREMLCTVCAGDAKEDSVFDLASLTKIATATQILRLCLQGLSLETEIREVLPFLREDAELSARTEGITLRRLLTHTSTLPAWYPFYALGDMPFPEALRTVLRRVPASRGVEYSDLNFMLLGKLLEEIRGKPLQDCLREDLVLPLNLGTMTYLPDRSLPLIPSSFGNPIEERMCRERDCVFPAFRSRSVPVVGQANDGNCHYYFRGVAGHAGIFADAAACERLCQYYMNAREELLLEAQREQRDAPGRGLGFQTGTAYPRGCGHTGFTGTGLYFSRSGNVGAVSLTNRLFFPGENPNATGEFRRALQEAVFALAGEIG